jgi:hypothetical protein
MHFLFSLLRINGLYMFRALLAHHQEALHKRHLVHCMRYRSVSCTRVKASFPIDLHSVAVFDSQMSCRTHAGPVPCHDHAVLKATSQGHGRARHGHGKGMAWVNLHRPSRDGMLAICPRSASSGYHAEFHEGCYQKHTNPLNCRTSSSDISGYHADFHEGHGIVGEWQGRGMAWQGNSMGAAWHVPFSLYAAVT